MRALYSLLLVLVRPLVYLRLKWRARMAPAYAERVGERFGRLPDTIPTGALWIHTVSAGETIAAAPLVTALVDDLAEHDIPVLVTTMTPTGSAEVQRLFGSTVAHCYAPYDFPDGVRRFLDATRPRALVLMETEIWPNLITMTAGRNIPVALVNARLSERSARGYARVQSLLTPVLRGLSWIACQYADDAQRFRRLGASGAQVEVVGNVKFDLAETQIEQRQLDQLSVVQSRASLAGRPVWIAGSTHDGEEEILLAAHRQVLEAKPDCCLILVPRHPERFAQVHELAKKSFDTQCLAGWLDENAEVVKVDPGTSGATQPEVLIADLMGLLRPLYALADVAFVGGSLVDLGGHNPIEAAVSKLPVLMGRGRYNFEAVCAAFTEAGCLHLASDADEISSKVLHLLDDDKLRRSQGERAAALVAQHRGATDRLRVRLRRLVAE